MLNELKTAAELAELASVGETIEAGAGDTRSVYQCVYPARLVKGPTGLDEAQVGAYIVEPDETERRRGVRFVRFTAAFWSFWRREQTKDLVRDFLADPIPADVPAFEDMPLWGEVFRNQEG